MPVSRNATFLLLTTLLCGCGYTLGMQQQPGVETVHVPIFRSTGFRRDTDYLLTEAVQREIKQRTPYRLADEATADTILRGTIVDVRKNALTESRFDDVREFQFSVAAKVQWIDRRSGRILQEQIFPIQTGLIDQQAHATLAPEVGHSLATAQTEAATELAARIVDMMEVGW